MSRQQTQVASLISELADDAAFLSTDGQPFVTLPTGQTLPLHEPILRDWLTWRFSLREGAAPTEGALHDALRLLRARACCASQRRKVALRVAQASKPGSPPQPIFIDLANELGESVEITEQGWSLTRLTPGITFRSTRGQLPLPKPTTNQQPPTPHPILESPKIREWLLSALRPNGPYPILILHGPPGSGKTTLARMLRQLLDPVTTPITALPSRQRAIENLAARQRVLVFDHVTRMSNSAADALCRIASGTGISVQELGDHRDPLLLDIARPIILTTPRLGVDDWQPRADLGARAIAVPMDAIPNPRPIADIEAEFESLRPHIQAELYTALSQSLNNHEPRTSNDERAALAAASAIADPVSQAIRAFAAERREWTGTATSLLPLLALPGFISPRALSQRLNLLTPFLTTVGLTIEHHRKHNGTRHITIRANPENLRHPPSPPPEVVKSPLTNEPAETWNSEPSTENVRINLYEPS